MAQRITAKIHTRGGRSVWQPDHRAPRHTSHRTVWATDHGPSRTPTTGKVEKVCNLLLAAFTLGTAWLVASRGWGW